MEKENRQIILTKPAWKVYERAGNKMQERLDRCFEELQKNPLSGGNIKPLTGKLRGLYRYRIGDWRVIYRIVHERTTIEVIAILPRGDAY
ncbi:MAG: type II toxin-antitoxin system RelE/ParE family toxin [Nitrospirota bacterium]